MGLDAKRDCKTHAATSDILQEQQHWGTFVRFENNAFEGLLRAAAPIYMQYAIWVLNSTILFLDTTQDGYASVWLLSISIDGNDGHLLDDVVQHECHEEALADALLLSI